MTPNTASTSSRLGCVIHLVLFRVLPVVLIVAIAWTGWQVIAAQSDQTDAQSSVDARHADYASTATALSVPVDGVSRDDGYQLVQFATHPAAHVGYYGPTATD